MLQHGDTTHYDIRKIVKMIRSPNIKPYFSEAAKQSTTDPKKTKELFDACKGRLDAETHKNRPFQLLNNIRGNIENLDYTHPELKKTDYQILIKKILQHMEQLQEKIIKT